MIYQSLSYKIIECAMTVHRQLGCGFLEKVYKNAMALELDLAGLKAEIEKEMKIEYKGKIVGVYFADIMVNDKIIIEIKCAKAIMLPHIYQVKNYLKSSRLQTGLIFNFMRLSLDMKRVFP
jgi:GxxExxY protein